MTLMGTSTTLIDQSTGTRVRLLPLNIKKVGKLPHSSSILFWIERSLTQQAESFYLGIFTYTALYISFEYTSVHRPFQALTYPRIFFISLNITSDKSTDRRLDSI